MNIVFVVGGSYKAFYLNNINKLKNVDLLVFQEGLLYDFDCFNETYGMKIVSNELQYLCQKLECKIVALVNSNLFGLSKKELLYADDKDVFLVGDNLKLVLKEKVVEIGFKNVFSNSNVNIKLNSGCNDPVIKKCNYKKIYFYCNKKGVSCVKMGKLKRKFRKICYFCLRF